MPLLCMLWKERLPILRVRVRARDESRRRHTPYRGAYGRWIAQLRGSMRDSDSRRATHVDVSAGVGDGVAKGAPVALSER